MVPIVSVVGKLISEQTPGTNGTVGTIGTVS
jgi:hypothetical protein